jgi:UDP-N-acetylglucosamine 2-epimerase
MPEEINRVVADHLARWLFAPTPTALANLAAEGITDGVELVGDLMQDLAARVLPEVCAPESLDALPSEAGPLQAGRYLFATIHRAENREPPAIAAWGALLRAVASPSRPVVLALHPGTVPALRAADVDLGPHVRVIAPLGYRSSLTAQLHAAAVLTDSGGVQREAAWLRVPCLVLRDRTEWLEAVADSSGRMALVGRDAARAAAELERVAPERSAADMAARRAASAHVAPAGAAELISRALA